MSIGFRKHAEAGRTSGISGPSRAPRALKRHRSELESEIKRSVARKKLAIGAVLAVLTVTSLCITQSTPMLISPIELVQCYALRIQQFWYGIFDPGMAPTGAEVMAEHPLFYWTMTNFGVTLAYLLSGAMLAVAGVVYQNVFRNPIASPAMLGVSSGIQLGVALLVFLFGTMAGVMLVERYALCYGVVAIVLVVLFALSALMGGGGRFRNVTNMLVVGIILNQLIGVFVDYFTWFVFDDELYDIYVTLTAMVNPVGDRLSWLFLVVGAIISILPIILFRFRMNVLSFTPAEMSQLGVDPGRLQIIALLCGTVAMVTAQLQIGMVAMITLVVPHISRVVFGAEFRKQLMGTVLIGACVLLACRIFIALIPYRGDIPVGVVVNLVLLPAFCWITATQQRRWE